MPKHPETGNYMPPDVTPKGNAPRDYSDSPLKQGRLEQEKTEALDTDLGPQPISIHELSQHYQDGLQTLQAVLELLPPSQAKINVGHYLDTSSLWAQQMFQEQEAKLNSLRRAR